MSAHSGVNNFNTPPQRNQLRAEKPHNSAGYKKLLNYNMAVLFCFVFYYLAFLLFHSTKQFFCKLSK